MNEHSRSISPPPPRPEQPPLRQPSHASLPAVALTLPEVADVALRAERRATRALEAIGEKPDPDAVPPVAGRGMRGEIAALRVEVLAVKAIVTSSEEAAKRRAKIATWVAMAFGGALLALAAGAVWRLGARVRLVEGVEVRDHVALDAREHGEGA